MDTWWVPPHQLRLKNQQTEIFGYDTTGTVSYCFNSTGFRGGEISDLPSVIQIGNSISFGIGLDQTLTFGALAGKRFGRPVINLSFGCYHHENHDNLHNLENISRRNSDDIILVQINNLDRRRVDQNVIRNNDKTWCVSRLINYIELLDSLLDGRSIFFLYWDDVDYDLPKWLTERLLIMNGGHVDSSLEGMPNTFGPKSHHFISAVLEHYIRRS